ncbi:LuxR C-terminal-related transcriptional regulator [Kitasatospora sp. NPDC059577]|uniref:helix-turn-helix transcriptional regulator n=1 Tax=Kitasatospora sp. NPDC059577 TaxID=3346873 RepID=UPI0036BD4C69
MTGAAVAEVQTGPWNGTPAGPGCPPPPADRAPAGHRLRAYLRATDPAGYEALADALRRAGVDVLGSRPVDGPPGAVTVAVGGTVEEALGVCPPSVRSGAGPAVLLVAERFTAGGVLRAVRSGARTMLRATDTGPHRLAAALRTARHGEGMIPQGVVLRLFPAGAEESGARRPGTPLTARQSLVLALVAEGHDNAAIARALSCSQHTVKNALYDLMARLQVRNRAHAVAHAVRAGLI